MPRCKIGLSRRTRTVAAAEDTTVPECSTITVTTIMIVRTNKIARAEKVDKANIDRTVVSTIGNRARSPRT